MARIADSFAGWDALVRRAVERRWELHRWPEVGYREVKTSEFICKELAGMGVAFKRGIAGGTGVMGWIRGKDGGKDERRKTKDESPEGEDGGNDERRKTKDESLGGMTNDKCGGDGAGGGGRCVALRADMDGLPVGEETGLHYASNVPGVMHACGHDGHMAILLGAAEVLAGMAKAGELPAGCVKLLFQPAEEGGCGAARMVESGVLENPGVEAIFGLHGWPGLEVGKVSTKAGTLLASVDGFRVVVKGKGGHAASPESCVDPVLCAAACVVGLQGLVSREVDPGEAAVVTVSQIHGGQAFNVIPGEVELVGTIRAMTEVRHRGLVAGVERVVRGVAIAHRCEVSVEWFGTTPATVNDGGLAEFVKGVAEGELGEGSFVWAPRAAMWGEDFAFYQQVVKGCFFVVGVRPKGVEGWPMLHHPKYDFSDGAVEVGMRMMVGAAVRFLSKGNDE